MAFKTGSKGKFSVKAYQGDMKTLLAFDFESADDAANLAGFSIQCQIAGSKAFYLWNELTFQNAAGHAQIATEPPQSTANAPIQKYRWTHVAGVSGPGATPVKGNYTYTVTPRFFDANQSMLPLDKSLSASVSVPVAPFQKGALTLGFTRGYMASEAFVNHFGATTPIEPVNRPLQFDTSAQAGTNGQNQPVTFAEIYAWMGSTARVQIFAVLNEVLNDASLQLDVFAYDLDEPDFVTVLLKLAAQGRIRIILDNSAEHVSHKDTSGNMVTTPEDEFTELFNAQAKDPAAIVRGCFDRYSHDKVLIVSKDGAAVQVLTGSTNFSVTGLYVNANHVLVFADATVASKYAEVFEESWTILSEFPKTSTKASAAFSATALATTPFTIATATVPKMSVTFSPHTAADATKILGDISARIDQEEGAALGNVLFAVMQLTGSASPVYSTLTNLHATETLFSYGISDAPGGIELYAPGSRKGVLVTGKPKAPNLPPPFNQVPSPPGHEIHDKFVVCGVNGEDPVVYCGSSNFATGGEEDNGDNLLAVQDADVATAFAIEALLLVDHYSFLDRFATASTPSSPASDKENRPLLMKQPQSKQKAAQSAGLFLFTTDAWSARYFDSNDLHLLEREIFG